ncbi:MAG: Crp/Fnr family transcriptional regulator [Nitrospirae bacterium]|nr:Crp/Fnr family transcriptional regulator [Nitrospirota bacterium]
MGIQLIDKGTPDIPEDLRCLPCLSLLKDEDFSDIAESVEIRRLCKHEILFLESEPLKSTFIVKAGSVKIYKTTGSGKELIIKILWPGDYYCYPPLKDDSANILNAMAFTDSTVLLIPSDKFKALLNTKVGDVGLNIVAGLCEKISILSDKLDDIAFKSVQERILKTLYALSDGLPVIDGTVTVSINHQELAALVGTAREVVSRIVGSLKEKKIILDSRTKNFKINKKTLLKYIKSASPPQAQACCGIRGKTK